MSTSLLAQPLLDEAAALIAPVQTALNRLILGQPELIELLLIGFFSRGHILLEGLPGLGKTELVTSLARLLELEVRRLQFTPDLLPGDITGNPMLEERDGRRQFVFHPGPVFTHLLIADEINRASPKTQSALLQAMQEREVSVLGETHPLPDPFCVIATQNPIELEGTYPLPEAQLDRFLFKLQVNHTPADVLGAIVRQRQSGQPLTIQPLLPRPQVLRFLQLAEQIYLPDPVIHYIATLVEGSHPGRSQAARAVRYGASARAALGLANAAKTRAIFQGRAHASFEDVNALAHAVLRHRLLLQYEARLEGTTPDSVIDQLLSELHPAHHQLPPGLQAAKVK